jgi:hypothetical protein
MQRKSVNWLQKKRGKLTVMLICFGLAYLFASLSIDRGNLWYYLLTLIFLVYGLKFGFKLIGELFHAVRH